MNKLKKTHRPVCSGCGCYLDKAAQTLRPAKCIHAAFPVIFVNKLSPRYSLFRTQ